MGLWGEKMESTAPNPLTLSIPLVDHRGRPIMKRNSGRWTAALFIIGVEIAERSAYCGIQLNLISYLTGELGESTAAAAANVNTWSGVAQMLPLLGAFLADSYLGRYRTIVIASVLYVLALAMLTISAMLPNLSPHIRSAFFYVSLYLAAFAQGGHKPCVQAFGADQFDETDPEESLARSSFFNWWYFGMNSGIVVSVLTLSYVQDNISWGLGFGIPCILMVIALFVFLAGTKTYRYYLLEDSSPFARIGKTFVALVRRKGASLCNLSKGKRESGESQVLPTCDQSKLDEDDGTPSATQLEEAKGVLRLFPIWAACLTFAIVFVQSQTFFTKQGSTLYRRIGTSQFEIPPAALQSLICISIVTFVPVYDRLLVPTARKFSNSPSGFSLLKRIGTGIFISMVAMVVAAMVEIKRLKTARDFGLIDQPKAIIPMSLWWLVPQYVLFGIADVFAMVGMQEFFYDQVPDALRSLGLALYLSILGTGSFISGLFILVIDKVSSSGGESWFSSNLNRAHLDYFYWLLAGLSAFGLLVFVVASQAYVYKKKGNGSV